VLPKAPTEFGRTPLLPHGAALPGLPVAARPRPAEKGAGSEEPGEMPRLRRTGSGGRRDQVGQASRLTALGADEIEFAVRIGAPSQRAEPLEAQAGSTTCRSESTRVQHRAVLVLTTELAIVRVQKSVDGKYQWALAVAQMAGLIRM
jgi:hypothetical protein